MKRDSMTRAFCLAAAFAAAGALAQTNVYKWTDKDGKVYFSDTPPPADAKSSSQKRLGGGYVETENLPYATQIAAQRNPVVLYTGAECGEPCKQARELLSRRGIPFMERDVQSSPEDAEALKRLTGGLDVPTVSIGESKVKGFEDGQWQAALDTAGYPRTRLPGQAAAQRAAPRAAEPAAAEPQAQPK
jgi:glutaredoxin